MSWWAQSTLVFMQYACFHYDSCFGSALSHSALQAQCSSSKSSSLPELYPTLVCSNDICVDCQSISTVALSGLRGSELKVVGFGCFLKISPGLMRQILYD